MGKRSSIKKEHDLTVTAFRVIQEATGHSAPDKVQYVEGEPPESRKNPHAVALGSLGGKKGGPARAMRLTAARRSEIARRAAEVRWRKQ